LPKNFEQQKLSFILSLSSKISYNFKQFTAHFTRHVIETKRLPRFDFFSSAQLSLKSEFLLVRKSQKSESSKVQENRSFLEVTAQFTAIYSLMNRRAS